MKGGCDEAEECCIVRQIVRCGDMREGTTHHGGGTGWYVMLGDNSSKIKCVSI